MTAKIKPGDMIQVWDTFTQEFAERIIDHGKLGYIVRSVNKGETVETESGPFTVEHDEEKIFKCVLFDAKNNYKYQFVNELWLRKINDSSDIKIVQR